MGTRENAVMRKHEKHANKIVTRTGMLWEPKGAISFANENYNVGSRVFLTWVRCTLKLSGVVVVVLMYMNL